MGVTEDGKSVTFEAFTSNNAMETVVAEDKCCGRSESWVLPTASVGNRDRGQSSRNARAPFFVFDGHHERTTTAGGLQSPTATGRLLTAPSSPGDGVSLCWCVK